MVDDIDVLLGLPGFRVVAVAEVTDELHVHVETVPGPVGCPSCGVLAVGHGRLRVHHRDLPIGARPTVLVWHKRRFRCAEQACRRLTWVECCDQLPGRRLLTGRAASEIARSLAGSPGAAVAPLAARFGVSWATAWAAFRERADPAVAGRLDRLAPPVVFGVDETTFLRSGRRRFGDRWCTSMVDVGGARLLDVAPGRSAQVISAWVSERGPGWSEGIEVTVCDPFRAYARGLRAAAPHAALVIDHYHLCKLGLDTLDAVRANVTRETLGRRGRKGDHLYDLRRRLLTAPERLTATGYSRLRCRLGHGDPHGQVTLAWRLAHQLRGLGHCGSARTARRRLHTIIDQAAASDRPELHRLARTLREWAEPICARYDHDRVTNAVVEAINTLIKKLKRAGHGYRNFANYRLRLLTACGKIPLTESRPTARLRTRTTTAG